MVRLAVSFPRMPPLREQASPAAPGARDLCSQAPRPSSPSPARLSVCLSVLPGSPTPHYTGSSIASGFLTHTYTPHYFCFFLLFRLFLCLEFSGSPPFLTSGGLALSSAGRGVLPTLDSDSSGPTLLRTLRTRSCLPTGGEAPLFSPVTPAPGGRCSPHPAGHPGGFVRGRGQGGPWAMT